MTWDVLQNDSYELMLIEHDSTVPDGWSVVAVTANPDYLEYMASLG